MKRTVELAAAPTGMQPGGYVPKAYAGRGQPFTPSATIEAVHGAGGWRIQLSWACPEPVRDIRNESDLFVDAAALAAPTADDAPWVTMGAPGRAIEGVLWRANESALRSFHAEGLGSVKRSAAPGGWMVKADWAKGAWQLAFELPSWPQLDARPRLAFAIWRGAARDRGGLKSISPGWIELLP